MRLMPREATKTSGSTGVMATACGHMGNQATREAPPAAVRDRQLDAREGQARPTGVAERLVVSSKPGNSGGGKEPRFETSVRKSTRARRLAMSLSTPGSVRKLRETLHAKAK